MVRTLLAAAALVLLWQGVLLIASIFFAEPFSAEYGTLEIGRKVEAVVFRTERLITAPCDGRFVRYHAAGERIARHGLVGIVEPAGAKAKRKVATPAAGLLCYTFDGLEGEWPRPRLLADPEGAYRAGRKSRPRPTAAGGVRRGVPVARLVEDSEGYLLVRLRGKEEPAAGKRLWARLRGGAIPLEVVATTVRNHESWLILRTELFPPDWLDRRRVEFELIFARFTGTLVPLRYLYTRGEQTGVFVLRRGRAVFRAVKVLGQDRDRAVLADLPPGTLLVTR